MEFKIVGGVSFEDIILEDATLDNKQKIARITLNRPHRLNAFTSDTIDELLEALSLVERGKNRVLLLTGAGDKAFCSGGDVKERGERGYFKKSGEQKLHVLELYTKLRYLPIPTIAIVKGYAIGGGQILQLVCDITIATPEAVFGQNGPKVGSFDAGIGAQLLALTVGLKRAKEMWFRCHRISADEALKMGLINHVVESEKLDSFIENLCREICELSPSCLRFIKFGFNALTDGMFGFTKFAHETTGLFYSTDEALEGREAFKNKRKPDFSRFLN